MIEIESNGDKNDDKTEFKNQESSVWSTENLSIWAVLFWYTYIIHNLKV